MLVAGGLGSRCGHGVRQVDIRADMDAVCVGGGACPEFRPPDN